MSEQKKSCAKPNMVNCDLRTGKEAANNCKNCIDVTVAYDFLLKEVKPKSGTLRPGIINLDAVPLIMTKFYESLTNHKPTP